MHHVQSISSYIWTNINTGVLLGRSSPLTLNPTYFSPDDIIQCEATVEDTAGETDTGIITVTVENRPRGVDIGNTTQYRSP